MSRPIISELASCPQAPRTLSHPEERPGRLSQKRRGLSVQSHHPHSVRRWPRWGREPASPANPPLSPEQQVYNRASAFRGDRQTGTGQHNSSCPRHVTGLQGQCARPGPEPGTPKFQRRGALQAYHTQATHSHRERDGGGVVQASSTAIAQPPPSVGEPEQLCGAGLAPRRECGWPRAPHTQR